MSSNPRFEQGTMPAGRRRTGVRGGARGLALAAALGLSLAAAPARAADPPPDDPLTFQTSDGEHSLKLSLESRFRQEWWDARASDTESFSALRTRVSAKYVWKDVVEAFIQAQDARIHGMESELSGAGGLYYRFADMRSKTHGTRIRQLWVQVEPVEDLKFRVGRQDIKLGTEVMYAEPNWKYLKVARGSQRLVGTVGWTHGERSNDGVVATYDLGDYLVYAFGAKPTTGVFDLRRSYATQDRITYGGATLTAKRGTWLPDTEVRLFGLGYEDKRHMRDAGLSDNRSVNVYTTGFSLIRVHPMDGGNADLLLWGAYQWGSFPDVTPTSAATPRNSLSHNAWAALAEAGYQFTERKMKPWVRIGLNIASGDKNSNDSTHGTFFNMLPTNHLYYGFADQFALQNIIDYFVQLKLTPLPKSDLNLMLHRIQLYTSDDAQYFGTGAFSKQAIPGGFGFGANPSNGHHSVGTELDVIASYKVNKRVALQAGYSYIWGNAVFNALSSDDDVRFGYLQVMVKYP
jgi:hypothetical protein